MNALVASQLVFYEQLLGKKIYSCLALSNYFIFGGGTSALHHSAILSFGSSLKGAVGPFLG